MRRGSVSLEYRDEKVTDYVKTKFKERKERLESLGREKVKLSKATKGA